MTSSYGPEIFGADPSHVQWKVVRGDDAVLRVEFYQDDETTPYDTTGWTFESSAYDFRGEVTDELEVTAGSGYVDITAPADITALWGAGYSKTVAELAFDLQVTLNDDTIWTPVIGTIKVLGDVTGGSL